MDLSQFTPGSALLGGLLIGSAAALLMLLNGQIAGISGITKGILFGCPTPQQRRWRLTFVGGLVIGGLFFISQQPEMTAAPLTLPAWQMAVGGLLVGLGTAMGNGCTSGHGVCGLGRRSKRSLASVLTFMGAGFGTLFLMTQLFQLGRF